MKKLKPFAHFIFLLCMISGSMSGQQRDYSQYMHHPWVDSVLSTLSREEKIAQTLWVYCSPGDGFQELMESARVIQERGLGGIIFTAAPDKQMKELARYCLSMHTLNPVIALEGSWFPSFPDKTSLAAIASDSLRYLAGAELAAQFRKEGVSVLLSGEIDDVLAKGLGENHVQVLDPGWIQADSLELQARRVLALKYWIKQEADITAARDQKAFIRDLYAQSLTVLKNQDQVIPVKDLERIRVASLVVNEEDLTEFQQMAGMYTRTSNYYWSGGKENSEKLLEKLAAYDLVLVGLYPGQYGEEISAFLSSLKQGTKLVAVWFGNPYALENNISIFSGGDAERVDGLIIAYGQNPYTERLSAQLIFGGIGGKGILPVALGDSYPVGHGINTPGGLRLQYGLPENAGLCSLTLEHNIDSIVKHGLDVGAYPGCQVIVARKGTVVFHKAYGHHTYDRRIEVRKNDLYDLASVTKISGPLSGLMMLEGLGKFSYQDRLGDYCQAMQGSDKADLALKDVLAHRAGLYPWIAYHQKTLKKNGRYKKRFIRSDKQEKFSIQVADRLYLSDKFKDKIFKEIRKSELGEQNYLYSGLSFFLFPTVIENLSGQPYESFLSEQIYHRLGAWELLYHPRSSYSGSRIVPTEYDSTFRKQLVHGYVHDEGAALMGAHAGNAGLFASSNDLLKLIEMYRRMGRYGGEQIIEEEVLKEYTSYQFPELEIRRGLGFDKPLLNESDGTAEDYPCPGASRSSFGHSGFTGTFVWADPEHEISYVFLSNRVHPTRTNQLLYNLNIRTNILQSVYDSILEN